MREFILEMECYGISRMSGLKSLTYRDNRLGLVLWLNVVKEHAIMQRDACSLSSLMVRGILVILQARVFL